MKRQDPLFLLSSITALLLLIAPACDLPRYLPQKPTTPLFKGEKEFHGDISFMYPSLQGAYSFSDKVYGEMVVSALVDVAATAGVGTYGTFGKDYGRWGLSAGGGMASQNFASDYYPLAYVQGYLGVSSKAVEGGLSTRAVYVHRLNSPMIEPNAFIRLGWKNVKLEGLVGISTKLGGNYSRQTVPNFGLGIHFYFGGEHETAASS